MFSGNYLERQPDLSCVERVNLEPIVLSVKLFSTCALLCIYCHCRWESVPD